MQPVSTYTLCLYTAGCFASECVVYLSYVPVALLVLSLFKSISNTLDPSLKLPVGMVLPLLAGINPSPMVLQTHCGKCMENNHTLADYYVQRHSTLSLLMILKEHQNDKVTAGLSEAQNQRLRKKMREGKT